MTSENISPQAGRVMRKLVIPALIGGVAGGFASFGMMRFIDSDAVGGLGLSATIAALVAVLYCVIAAGILLGTAKPGIGAKFLNVEDADELREQQRVLVWSGASMLLWGVGLLALALAAPDGPVPQMAALVIFAAGMVIGTALSVRAFRASDELMLAINLEAGTITYGLMFLIIGLWAMLAHLGFAAAPAPLDLLSAFYGLGLLGSFIAVGRRGMLNIR
jgi:hypothetical protein